MFYNAFGMGINGHATPYAPVARAAALALDGEVPGGATLLLDGRRTTIGGACLANSALFHGRAQEDTCGAAHFGTILIPMLTAMIEAKGYPLARLIPALVAGYEAGGVVEKALSGKTTPAGFRSSAIYGTIAASAAAGKLMELSAEQMAAALANAVSFSGGVLQSFADGTDEWRYQVGVVARNGLRRRRAGARRFGLGAARLRGQVRLRARLRQDRSRRRSRRRAWPGLGHPARRVQALSGLRFQSDAGDRCAGVAAGIESGAGEGARAHEPLRDRLCRHGRGRAVRYDLGDADEHPVLYRHHAHPRRPDDAPHDDIQRCGGERSDQACRARLRPLDPILSAIIEAETTDGVALVREQRMTAADYAYDLPTLSAMLRRIGAEEGVPMSAFDRLERFVERLPQGSIEDAISVFTLAPSRARAA